MTDRLGIHRESLVIPLGPRHPGRVRRMPNGKIEIVVEPKDDFDGLARRCWRPRSGRLLATP